MTTHEVGAKFAELICADSQWLDEEFSALMAANFSAPPAWPARTLRPHHADADAGTAQAARPRPAAFTSAVMAAGRSPALTRSAPGLGRPTDLPQAISEEGAAPRTDLDHDEHEAADPGGP